MSSPLSSAINDVEIEEPADKDVLKGKGKKIDKHPGNINFRETIACLAQEYHQANNKPLVAKMVHRILKEQGARFLKEREGKWKQMDDSEILTKIMQQFRNKNSIAKILAKKKEEVKHSPQPQDGIRTNSSPSPAMTSQQGTPKRKPTVTTGVTFPKKARPNGNSPVPSQDDALIDHACIVSSIADICKEALELADMNTPYSFDPERLATLVNPNKDDKEDSSHLREAVAVLVNDMALTIAGEIFQNVLDMRNKYKTMDAVVLAQMLDKQDPNKTSSRLYQAAAALVQANKTASHEESTSYSTKHPAFIFQEVLDSSKVNPDMENKADATYTNVADSNPAAKLTANQALLHITLPGNELNHDNVSSAKLCGKPAAELVANHSPWEIFAHDIDDNVSNIDTLSQDISSLSLNNQSAFEFFYYSVDQEIPKNITKLIIGENMTEIKAEACKGFEWLKEIDMSASLVLETIGEEAFRGCGALSVVKCAPNVKTIGKGAFRDCTKLQNVDLSEAHALETIGDYAFAYCLVLSVVKCAPNVKTIGYYGVFRECTKLQEVECIYNSEDQEIPENITKLITGNNITEIKKQACKGFGRLKEVDTRLSLALETIGEEAFEGCSALSVVKWAPNEGSQRQDYWKPCIL